MPVPPGERLSALHSPEINYIHKYSVWECVLFMNAIIMLSIRQLNAATFNKLLWASCWLNGSEKNENRYRKIFNWICRQVAYMFPVHGHTRSIWWFLISRQISRDKSIAQIDWAGSKPWLRCFFFLFDLRSIRYLIWFRAYFFCVPYSYHIRVAFNEIFTQVAVDVVALEVSWNEPFVFARNATD